MRFELLRKRSVLLMLVFALISFETARFGVSVATESNETSIIFSGRLFGDESSIRIILEADREFKDDIQYLDNPKRIVIEFAGTRLSFSNPDSMAARGLISDLRYGSTRKDKSRLILDLKGGAKILARESSRRKNGHFQLIYDIAAITDDEFIALRSNNVIIPNSPTATQKSQKNTEFPLVVIDPGHGGIDGGAQGNNGIVEKNVTLSFAKRLKFALEGTGKIRVQLTRSDDRFLSLKKRVAIVRKSKANLFLSIHADSLKQKNVRGATIYTLSKKASDSLAKNLADAENRADLIGGDYVESDIDNAVVEILADLAMRETNIFSRRFAKKTVNLLKNDIKLIKNPHRFASFGVLKAPNTPSILLELGYLSNGEDAKLLQSEVWQARFSEILAQAIAGFFNQKK